MLLNCILVGVGGGLGAVLRVAASNRMKKFTNRHLPLPTFLINVLGSFLLGFLLQYQSGSTARLLFGTGILGGFTTFSTFHYEAVSLLRGDNKITAILYVLLSLFFGLAAAWAGLTI